MPLLETIIRYFYHATLSFDANGGMLIASSKERVLTWGIAFCILALISLILWQLKIAKHVSRSIFMLTFIIPILIIPSIKQEKIYVTEFELIVHTGYWFYPQTRHFNLDDLDDIQQEIAPFALAKLIGEEDVTWNIRKKNGEEEMLDLNGFFNDHRMTVAAYLRDHGRVINFLSYVDCVAECWKVGSKRSAF